MQKITCHDCGKQYDYQEDAFCPHCGAFNQPPHGEAGARPAVRVDGINEAGHENSFVHRELHEETRERRRVGLDKSVQRIQRAEKVRTTAAPIQKKSVPGKPMVRSPFLVIGLILLTILVISAFPLLIGIFTSFFLHF